MWSSHKERGPGTQARYDDFTSSSGSGTSLDEARSIADAMLHQKMKYEKCGGKSLDVEGFQPIGSEFAGMKVRRLTAFVFCRSGGRNR